MKKYSVLLIEDIKNTRERLAAVVSGHKQLELLAAAENFSVAKKILEKESPDVMLTDIDLPDGNGIDLIKLARKNTPKTEIMVITVFGDEKHVVSAIEAGATGYILKDGESEYIVDSIMQLLAGGSPISVSIARHLLKKFSPPPTPQADIDKLENEDIPYLTTREREVLEAISKGFSYADIAGILGMSVHTVTSHIKKIYRKLSVHSRSEAVFEAMQMGLIDSPR